MRCLRRQCLLHLVLLLLSGAARASTAEGGADAPSASADATVVAPTRIVDSPARYPAELVGSNIAGEVLLRIQVDADGAIERVEVVRGVHPALDAEALRAATLLQFTPARKGELNVGAVFDYAYRFEVPVQRPATESVILRGVVRAKGDRRLLRATVEHPASQTRVETTEDGRFELKLAPGVREIDVAAAGYKRQRFYEVLKKGEQLEVIYRLEPDRVNPYETVVRADRERTEVSRITLHDAEIREVPGTMGDPFRVVMLMPGVSTIASGIAYPVVRGSEPAATGYYLDGVRVPLLFHLFLGPAVVHPSFIDSIDFYPGSAPVRFGRNIGGVIEGQVSRPNEERLHANAYLDLINAGGFVEYPFQETGTQVGVAARLSYTPFAIGLASQVVSAMQNNRIRLEFWDYQSRVEQKLGRGKLRLLAFGSSDVVGFESSAGTGQAQTVRFHRVDVRYRSPLGAGDGEVGLTYGNDRLGIDTTNFNLTQSLGVSENRFTARSNWAVDLSRQWRWTIGAELEHRRAILELGLDGSPAPGGPALPAQTANSGEQLGTFAGLYSELRWKPADRWTVVPGLRVDSYHVTPSIQHFAVEPRLMVRHALSDTVTLKGGTGLYHQAPTTLVPIPIVDMTMLLLGLQRSLQASTGVEWKLSDQFNFSAEVYANRLLRSVEASGFSFASSASAEPPTPEGEGRGEGGSASNNTFLGQDALASTGYSYGLELMLRHPLGGNWFGWLTYTLQRSTRYRRFIRASDGSSAEGQLPFIFDQTHILNAVLSYRFPGNITAGVVVHINSGRPDTGALEARGSAWAPVDDDQTPRLPTFFRVDARIAKSWALDNYVLDLYLDVLNASLSQEIVGWEYRIPPEKVPIGLPIVVPILGLKGTFQ